METFELTHQIIDPVLYQQFLSYREGILSDLTSRTKTDNGLCMIGKIRTLEKCPKCKGKFIDTGKDLVCVKCLTHPRPYFVDICWKGRRFKLYSDTDGRIISSYELAHRVLAQIRQEIDHKTFDPRDYQAKDYRKLQFETYVKNWLKGYEVRMQKGDIANSYYRKVKQYVYDHFIPFFGITDIREIRAMDIKELYYQLPDGISLKTQKNIMDVLRKIFKDAYQDEIIAKMPKFPKIAVPEPSVRWLDEETQDKVINAIPEQHQPIFILMARTGIRPGEARAIKRKDIDFKNKFIIIDKAFSENEFHPYTKSKTAKIVLLDDFTIKILKKMPQPIDPDDFLFKTQNGTYYSHYRLWEIFKNASKKVGVDGLTLYQATKHSFASQAINRGVPREVIQKFLGHASSRSTDRYARMNLDSLRVCLRSEVSVKRPSKKESRIISFKNKEL